jgi:hypothetical protein
MNFSQQLNRVRTFFNIRTHTDSGLETSNRASAAPAQQQPSNVHSHRDARPVGFSMGASSSFANTASLDSSYQSRIILNDSGFLSGSGSRSTNFEITPELEPNLLSLNGVTTESSRSGTNASLVTTMHDSRAVSNIETKRVTSINALCIGATIGITVAISLICRVFTSSNSSAGGSWIPPNNTNALVTGEQPPNSGLWHFFAQISSGASAVIAWAGRFLNEKKQRTEPQPALPEIPALPPEVGNLVPWLIPFIWLLKDRQFVLAFGYLCWLVGFFFASKAKAVLPEKIIKTGNGVLSLNQDFMIFFGLALSLFLIGTIVATASLVSKNSNN